MNSTLSLILQELNACKNEITALEEMNNHIKIALDNIPFPPRSRKHINNTYLRCVKDMHMLKSSVLNTEILFMETRERSIR